MQHLPRHQNSPSVRKQRNVPKPSLDRETRTQSENYDQNIEQQSMTNSDPSKYQETATHGTAPKRNRTPPQGMQCFFFFFSFLWVRRRGGGRRPNTPQTHTHRSTSRYDITGTSGPVSEEPAPGCENDYR